MGQRTRMLAAYYRRLRMKSTAETMRALVHPRRLREHMINMGRFRCWYAIARLGQPDIMVETGVHDGLSSALILRAMDRNGKGTLISIDLPAMDMPAGLDGPGWLVPPSLRSRWERKLGDARKLLPEVIAKHPRIDVFIHDSDHERGHREFEFRTARRGAAPGALPLSDDDADDLLDLLAGAWSGARAWVRCTLPNGDTAHLGGIRLAGD